MSTDPIDYATPTPQSKKRGPLVILFALAAAILAVVSLFFFSARPSVSNVAAPAVQIQATTLPVQAVHRTPVAAPTPIATH